MRFNHSSAIPRYIIAVDTETLPIPDDFSGKRFSHHLRLGVAICVRIKDGKATCKQVHRFRTKESFWQIVASYAKANYTTWIVAHNALFDMVVAGMPEQFEQGKIVVEWPRSKRNKSGDDDSKATNKPFICIESPPTVIAAKVGATQGRIVIVDTLNWFQCPLSDLGESCGLPKYEMPAFSADSETWFRYCERDTEIVLTTFLNLVKWVKDNEMGMFRYTGPSQAIAAYRHRWLKHEILVHDNFPVKAIERSAYFGGRFECFRLGPIAETVHQLDVNALFPSVMVGNAFPNCLDRYELRSEFVGRLDDFSHNRSVAECELCTSNPVYPVRTDKGVIYPVGTFKTTLCGPELELAIQNGDVIGIRSWAEYQTAPIFREWVADLWKMRQDYKQSGNLLYERFTKMLMNSLYGKFGQRSPEWESVTDRNDALPWMQWIVYNGSAGIKEHYRSFGWLVQRKNDREIRHHASIPVTDWNWHASTVTKGELCSTFVAISAFVTAYARLAMNNMRAISGTRNTLYQGVDSLVVNSDGLTRLQSGGCVAGNELGKMRLQLTADHGEIFGCSDYRIGDKIVIAGLSRPTTVAEQQSAMQRTMSAKAGLFRGYAASHVTEEVLPWKRSAEYWKGIVNADQTVAPLTLGGM
jgi:hypothetical protein